MTSALNRVPVTDELDLLPGDVAIYDDYHDGLMAYLVFEWATDPKTDKARPRLIPLPSGIGPFRLADDDMQFFGAYRTVRTDIGEDHETA